MAREVTISERSHITLRLLLVVMGFLLTSGVGAVAWITTLHADVAQAKADISRQERLLHRLDKGLVRVQYKLGIDIPDEEHD